MLLTPGAEVDTDAGDVKFARRDLNTDASDVEFAWRDLNTDVGVR